jgi:hypothetical protein
MTWVIDNSGTLTATINIEHVLSSGSVTNATYALVVRLNNMVLGDVVELRTYTTTLSGGTQEQCGKATFGPWKPYNLVTWSIPVPSDVSFKVTLKQIAGTGRAFDWKLLRI